MKERIREFRKSLGLTQTEFGAQLGITRAAVASYEMGTANPTGSAIRCMELKYGLNPVWLETGEGNMLIGSMDEYSRIADEMNASPALRSLIAIWAQLDDERQRVLEEFVADYVDEYLKQREEMFLSATNAMISDIPPRSDGDESSSGTTA